MFPFVFLCCHFLSFGLFYRSFKPFAESPPIVPSHTSTSSAVPSTNIPHVQPCHHHTIAEAQKMLRGFYPKLPDPAAVSALSSSYRKHPCCSTVAGSIQSSIEPPAKRRKTVSPSPFSTYEPRVVLPPESFIRRRNPSSSSSSSSSESSRSSSRSL
jgi:hypothetical protein